jgi:2-haloacid dehalogenase
MEMREGMRRDKRGCSQDIADTSGRDQALTGTAFGMSSFGFTEARAMAHELGAVVFDIFGTLFSLEPLADRLEKAGLPRSSLDLLFARTLKDAFALEVAGDFHPFREVMAGTLRVLFASSGRQADPETIDRTLDAFSELRAFPDVRPAFELVRERRIRVVTLGNGSAATVARVLERAQLAPFVDAVLSIEDARHWKPHAAAYQHAERKLGLGANRLAMVAAHAWDVQGAKRAGWRAAWVSRLEKQFHPAMHAADAIGSTVEEAVRALLEAV